MLTTAPASETVLRFLQRRPAAINLAVVKADGVTPVDLTGANIRLTIAQPKRKGGAVLQEIHDTPVDLALGLSRIDIQADQLNYDEGQYPFSITLDSPEQYESTIVQGFIELGYSPEVAIPADYDPALVPPLGLTVELLSLNKVVVRTNHHPDSVLAAFQAAAYNSASAAGISAAAAAASAADAEAAAVDAGAGLDAIDAAVTAAQAAAGASSTSAGQSSTSAGQSATSATAASNSAAAAAGYATQAGTSAASATTSATAAAASVGQAAAQATAAGEAADEAADSAVSAASAVTAAAASAVAAAAAAALTVPVEQWADDAEVAALAAAASQLAAAASATAASTSATAAAGSATAAGTSATAAAGSATSAATAATTAAGSATSAATSAALALDIVDDLGDGIVRDLINDSASLTGALLRTLFARQLQPAIAAGQYFYPISQNANSTSNTLANITLRLAPWVVTRAITIDRLGAEITAAGDAASVLRLGIYADNGNSLPGSLVLDAGTIAGNSATVQQVTIPATTLQPGLYWIGGAVQGVTTTQPTIRTVANTSWTPGVLIPTGTSLPSAGAAHTMVQMTNVSGALPTTFVPGGSFASVPRVFARAA